MLPAACSRWTEQKAREQSSYRIADHTRHQRAHVNPPDPERAPRYYRAGIDVRLPTGAKSSHIHLSNITCFSEIFFFNLF